MMFVSPSRAKKEQGLCSLSKGGVDTSLSSDGVGSGREQLRDTGGLEAGLGKTEGGPQTSTAGADDDGIIFVVDDRILFRDRSEGFLRPEDVAREDL